MEVLPMKMSALLRVAMDDLKAVRKRANVQLNMGVWYSKRKGTCVVCMAGAVMLNRGLVQKGVSAANPNSCSQNTMQLLAIDSMRDGAFLEAAERLGIDLNHGSPDVHAVHSARATVKQAWRGGHGMATVAAYKTAIKTLEAVGL